MQTANSENFEKFQTLAEEKRERILNAAMKEFCSGYKNASTDNIVKEAGISKGLLFHYFGTKERLYNFLIDYAIQTTKREYIDLINIIQPDILESVWQLSLLKQDLSIKYPTIFDFLTTVYMDTAAKSEATTANLARFGAIQAEILSKVHSHTDISPFRDDIDPKTAMEIINWTLNGYARSKAEQKPFGSAIRENYDQFLAEFEQILNTLRKCLYK